jgi:hypothetical protein
MRQLIPLRKDRESQNNAGGRSLWHLFPVLVRLFVSGKHGGLQFASKVADGVGVY